MGAGHCVYCGAEIDAASDYRKIVGWERSRSAGGTNAVALREPTDEWACRWCIERLKRGITAEQGSLL
jgi:hypothetical protein